MLNAIATSWKDAEQPPGFAAGERGDRSFVILCLGFAKDAEPEQVTSLKRALIDSPVVLNSVEAEGAFDMVLELAVSDPATYYRWLLSITGPYGEIVVREEVCFGRRPLAEDSAEIVVWVPDKQGTLGLRRDSVIKITAEGDYMRVHAEGRSWVVHATMQSFDYLLADNAFVQIHRSTMVRADAIARIDREEGHCVLRLCDGSSERVARSRATSVRKLLNDRSTTIAGNSSKT